MNQTPMHEFHVSMGAKMVEFAGWNMPLYYRSIHAEHVHTRSKMSVFDVSHMGNLRIEGDKAEPFLQRICTRDLAGTHVGQSRYTHVCREDGGILDDVIVSRHDDHWMMVCNASNREKIVAWLQQHAAGYGVAIIDETLDCAMLAVQGPLAVAYVESRFGLSFKNVKRYHFITGDLFGMRYNIYRSGYTGEDGIEAILPAGAVSMVLPRLFGDDLKADGDCKPAGLGARDTLRLEAAMPLYGHELSEQVDSISAGQGWCVQLDKDFIGVDALRRIQDAGPRRRLVGFELEGRRVARQGYRVLAGGDVVGRITSGAWSPTLRRSIAMGFVDVGLAEPGNEVSIDLGRKENPAKVVPLPFYKRTR